jgi:hypothetical protein
MREFLRIAGTDVLAGDPLFHDGIVEASLRKLAGKLAQQAQSG